jgi:hypothetical protein
MTLLIALTDGISGLASGDLSYTEKARVLLHALPRGWLPTLRVHLNVGNEGNMRKVFDARMKEAGVDRFGKAEWVANRTHEEIAVKLNELA